VQPALAVWSAFEEIRQLALTAAHFCNHEKELSRHLPRGDHAAASRQIQQRIESPAFAW
jgi:hypothetical protein